MKPIHISFAIRAFAMLGIGVGAACAADPILDAVSGSPDGTIIRYRSNNGSIAGQFNTTYIVGSSTYLPRHVTAGGGNLFTAYGDRFFGKLNPANGQRAWLVDAGITIGATTYLVQDVAYAGDAIYVATGDPNGYISKYRVSDGALLSRWASTYTNGGTTNLPTHIQPVADKIYITYGNRYLARLSANNGQREWLVDAGITQGVTTYGIAAMAWMDGNLQIANSLGYLEQRNPADGQRNWQADACVTQGASTMFISEQASAAGILYPVHTDSTGLLMRFRTSDGASLGSYNTTYQVGYTINLPRMLHASGTWLHLAYGTRYVSRIRASDGQIQWVVDAGIQVGYTTYFLAELAQEPVPPSITTTVTPPSGTNGAAYTHTFAASGQNSPFTWTLTGGTLPPGLGLSSSGVLSGTPSSAGTYPFTVQVADPAFSTATAPFSIVIQTQFAAWKTQVFGADAGDPLIADDLADPDGDGLSNLVEYALNLPPRTPDAAPFIVERFAYSEGERLRIFIQRNPARSDVTVSVEAASDITGPWTAVATSAFGSPFAGAGFVGGDSPTPGLKTVEIRDIVNTTDAPQRFIRVKVTH